MEVSGQLHAPAALEYTECFIGSSTWIIGQCVESGFLDVATVVSLWSWLSVCRTECLVCVYGHRKRII